MKRVGSVALIALFAGLMCFGQAATSAPPSAPAAATGHGAFPVKLTKSLDSSKLKEGDAVEAETVGSFKLPDGTLVPKGSKLAGHVTMAKARSKGDPDSQLTLAFEKLNVAHGKQLAIKGVVQAVFPPAEEAQDPQMAGAASVAAGGGMGAPGTVTNSKSGDNMASANKPQPAADPKSAGVHGIHDLELGQDGVLTSKGKHVKLDNGVRMIVRVDILS